MTDKRTHNISTFAEDDRIVQAVQKHLGTNDYSAAVRFIIRQFAAHADSEGRIFNKRTNARTVKRRTVAGKARPRLDSITSVERDAKVT
jgi:hypothetical protein